jgi:uncharacterized protein
MNDRALWIDKEGRWFFQGEEITHRKTYLLYCRNLTLDETGRPLLRIGHEECRVEVEDVPFVVKSVDFIAAAEKKLKSIDLLLNDETREILNPETLRVGRENILYCQVQGGKFSARFSRNAYQLLFPYIENDEKGQRFFLTLDGREYLLA